MIAGDTVVRILFAERANSTSATASGPVVPPRRSPENFVIGVGFRASRNAIRESRIFGKALLIDQKPRAGWNSG
jgi:hypothetical protein